MSDAETDGLQSGVRSPESGGDAPDAPDAPNRPDAPAVPPRSLVRVLALYLLGPVVLWWVLSQFVASVTWMVTGSMSPTLRADSGAVDGVLVDRLSLRFRAPRRGEIVWFRLRDGDLVLKRVMGLPGETISIAGGHVVVDGKPVTDLPEVAAINYVNAGHMGAGVQIMVSPGNYLVLGDDSADSWDSRFWGCVSAADLRGCARAILWPPARVRWL